jgi:hypothetical protein
MTTAVTCYQHPDVETELRCGRCERPICVRCLVHTPGGIRCRECARLRRPVMYELSPSHYARAGGTALLGAVVLGLAAAVVLPLGRSIPFLGLMIGLLVGAAAGTGMAEALTRATNGKRGLTLQLAAGAGLGMALLIYLVLTDSLIPLRLDLIGLVAAIVGIVAAAQRLR